MERVPKEVSDTLRLLLGVSYEVGKRGLVEDGCVDEDSGCSGTDSDVGIGRTVAVCFLFSVSSSRASWDSVTRRSVKLKMRWFNGF